MTPPLDPNRPFRPASFPFFYGWVVLVVGALGILASIPGQTMGVSVFTDHLVAATGLSRVALSNAYLVGTLASGLCLPLGGRVLHRFGERATAVLSCFGMAVALVGLSRIGATASFALLALGFAALRFSGQGMLTLSSRNMVPKWFERWRGLASGLLGAFVTLGFSIAPLVLAWWIAAAGDWRAAWLGMAVVVGSGMALVAWAFYRDDPESCGLRMDGDAAPVAAGPDPRPVRDSRALDLERALRSGAFWALTLALAIHSALVTGVTFHIVDLGAAAGLDETAAVGLFPPIAAVSVVTSLTVGALADFVRMRRLVTLLLLAEASAYLALVGLEHVALRWTAIVCLGIASGSFSALTTAGAAKLFGRLHLGRIASAQMSALVIASALGPSLLAISRDATGSYAAALAAGAAAPLVVLVVTLVSRDPIDDGHQW